VYTAPPPAPALLAKDRLGRFFSKIVPFGGLSGALEPGARAHFRILQMALHLSGTTPLVTKSAAFYNPSNTALEAEVSFTWDLGDQPPKRTVVFSASECLNIDLHFGNSQEH
jgi:hypothetical protein